MQRRVAVVALVIMSVWFAAAPTSAAVPPEYAPRGIGDTYLALGDSLVTGTETVGNADGWAATQT